MAWKFGTVRVYANQDDSKREQIIARLQPIDAGTILHIWGWEDEIKTFGGMIVTTGDLETLKGYYNTGLSYTLSSDYGSLGDYFVKNLQYTRTPTTNIVLFDRPEISCTDPTFDIVMELYRDE